MSNNIGSSNTLVGASRDMKLFSPEPRSNLRSSMTQIMGGVVNAISGGASSFAGIDGGFTQLLQQQMEAQAQMQMVSMSSNIEKSKHETSMAPIRNTRVS